MKKRDKRKTWMIVLAAALLPLALVCWFGMAYLSDSPFASEFAFEGPSAVSSGPSGRVYVVDGGKKEVLILDENGALESRIIASDDGFYYASLVSEGANSSLYIADTLYSGEGTALAAERVFRYDANGANSLLIHEISYEGESDPPFQYGRITSLVQIGGELVFSQRLEEGAMVSRLNLESGGLQETYYSLEGLFLSDVNVNPMTLLPVFTTRLGQAGWVNEAGEAKFASPSDRVAWRVCADEANLYYTDLATNELVRHEISSGTETAAITGEDILYTAFETGGRLYSTDYYGYYVLQGEAAEYAAEPPLKNTTTRALVWAALLLLALCALALIVLLLAPLMHKRRSATFQRVVIVVVVSLCVGALVAYITLNQTIADQSGSIMEQLNLFNDILVEAADVTALKNVQSVSDYRSANYTRVKAPLDELAKLSYDNGMYYYYAIYATDGDMIYGVMDYEDTITSRHPFYPFGAEGYTNAFLGETVEYAADVSSFGSWSFVLKPIFDDDGAVAAVMEVGVNLDDVNAQNRALVLELALMVASMAVVLLIIIIEWIFFFEQLETRRLENAPGLGVPARALIFLAFLADCMQDAFVSILSRELYVPFLGIPESIGAALPLSVQVLMSAVMAFAGGSLVYRSGIKRALPFGFALQTAGFILCGATMHYWGLMAGKALIGAGMGLIVVSVNTAAASDGASSSKIFAAISAGTLAGATAGAGVGSIVLSLGSYTSVYLAGAIILLMGLALALLAPARAHALINKAAVKTNAVKFLLDKRIITFLALLLLPFLAALSFREYFFPIYAAEMGVSEADIGRIYLVCGLVIIYAGPSLASKLLARLNAKWTVALASALMAGATLLFAFVPRLDAAIIGLGLLSLATAFGYTAQSTYYASLPGVVAYGESRAMGVYSLFDNVGQTLGPLVYGAAMLGGYQGGLLIIGIAIAALAGLFVASNSGKRKQM